MSRRNSNNRRTKSEIQARIAAKKKAKMLAFQKNIAIFSLLVLLAVGLVSTTFSLFVPDEPQQQGTLIADVKTIAVNQGHKEQITQVNADSEVVNTKADSEVADTKANNDVADTNANADLADTKANVDVAKTGYDFSGAYIIFDNTNSNWSDVQFFVGHGSWSQPYAMTKISNTNLYYLSNFSWGGATQFCFATGVSGWGGEGNSVSHRANYCTNSSVVTMGGSYNGFFYAHTSGSSDGTTTTCTHSDSGYSHYNSTQTVTVQSAEPGSSSYSNNTAAGSTTITTYKLNSNTGTTSSTGTTSATAAKTASVTLKATASTGYTFVGWYNSGGTQVSTNATYTYTCTGAATYYARFQKQSFTISYNVNGGTGSVASQTKVYGTTLTLTTTKPTRTNYTFVNWNTNSTGTGTSYASGGSYTANAAATLYAQWKPNAPTAISFTAANVASGTSGDGTSANPFIVFKSGGFSLTAKATVPSGSTAVYSTSPTGSYSATNTYSPSTTTCGRTIAYNVYAQSKWNSNLSDDYFSGAAYYMSFTHLNGANTDFTISANDITDAESITLSNPLVSGVATAEKTYITHTYQVSSDNSTFTDLDSDTWVPNATGTYYFRLKTTNTKTLETVYSTSKIVTVVQSTVYYDITVNRDADSATANVGLKTNGTAITDNKILSNEPLTISVTRSNGTPANYYFEYIRVTDGTTTKEYTNRNGDLPDTLVIPHVKGNVIIEYKSVIKPFAQPKIPTDAQAVSFSYYVDGVLTTVDKDDIENTNNGSPTYYVDYGSTIEYTVNPSDGYYVSDFTGVDLKSDSSWSSTQSIGANTNVTENVGGVNAKITKNKTITVGSAANNVDGASLTVDGNAYDFGEPVSLNYGVQYEVVVTAPDGFYPVVTTTSGVSVTPTISTDGKSTFKVTLTGTSSEYAVVFTANPKIYMEQPQYGSIYITSGTGDNTVYYFNGDSVPYGTTLTVHVKKDNQSNEVTNVKINGTSIGTTDGSTFSIKADSTATAELSLLAGYDNFEDDLEYGFRRIFFTDSRTWGSDVTAHVSNTFDDRDFSKNNYGMTFYYTNDYSQNVYYCDIPYDKKYVVFFDYGTQSRYTATATIDNTVNAFYAETGSSPFPIGTWTQYYSDYVAADRATSIQQAQTSKNEPVTFKYSCDFGDKILSAEVLAGNACTFDFDSGDLIITPTENTHNATLVKVTSAITKTEKYYLIRVENFEITDFSGIRKIYNSTILNNIQLQLVLNGGVLNFLADYSISSTGGADTYESIGSSSNFILSDDDTLEGYLNNFTLNYAANTMSGPKFYKVTASDSSGKKATAYQRTLFGTHDYVGARCMYFYNETNVDISKYDLRVCFFNDKGNQTWATMQPVGDTGYYRVTIPKNYESTVNIYLAKKNTFTNSTDDVTNQDMSNIEYCAYALIGAPVPEDNTLNVVYSAYAINSEGIQGEFVDFK